MHISLTSNAAHSSRPLATPKSDRIIFARPLIAERWTAKPERRPASTEASKLVRDRHGKEVEISIGNDTGRADQWRPWRSRKSRGRVVRVIYDGPSSVPNPPANDNAARVDWPLGKALRADGNDWLLAVAAGYRHIDELASAGGLLGKDIGESSFSIDQRTWVNPSGVIIYKGAREVTGGDPRPVSPTMATAGGRKLVPTAWNGDAPLHRKMDAQRLLSGIRAALGPLLQPTEDAVIGGWTLEAIGKREGLSDKPRACAVGKALVYRGLGALGGIFSSDEHRVALAELGIRPSV